MEHPDKSTNGWAGVWFIKYSAIYGFPLLFVCIAFMDSEGWFLILAGYLTLAVTFLAWRDANEQVTWRWRIGLAAVMTVSLAFTAMIAFIPTGDANICYDRVSKPHMWAPFVNRGPDPNCQGTPLEQVKLD